MKDGVLRESSPVILAPQDHWFPDGILPTDMDEDNIGVIGSLASSEAETEDQNVIDSPATSEAETKDNWRQVHFVYRHCFMGSKRHTR